MPKRKYKKDKVVHQYVPQVLIQDTPKDVPKVVPKDVPKDVNLNLNLKPKKKRKYWKYVAGAVVGTGVVLGGGYFARQQYLKAKLAKDQAKLEQDQAKAKLEQDKAKLANYEAKAKYEAIEQDKAKLEQDQAKAKLEQDKAKLANYEAKAKLEQDQAKLQQVKLEHKKKLDETKAKLDQVKAKTQELDETRAKITETQAKMEAQKAKMVELESKQKKFVKIKMKPYFDQKREEREKQAEENRIQRQHEAAEAAKALSIATAMDKINDPSAAKFKQKILAKTEGTLQRSPQRVYTTERQIRNDPHNEDHKNKLDDLLRTRYIIANKYLPSQQENLQETYLKKLKKIKKENPDGDSLEILEKDYNTKLEKNFPEELRDNLKSVRYDGDTNKFLYLDKENKIHELGMDNMSHGKLNFLHQYQDFQKFKRDTYPKFKKETLRSVARISKYAKSETGENLSYLPPQIWHEIANKVTYKFGKNSRKVRTSKKRILPLKRLKADLKKLM